jgi:hypothetical protein
MRLTGLLLRLEQEAADARLGERFSAGRRVSELVRRFD